MTPSWCPNPVFFDYKRYIMETCLAVLYTVMSIMDFLYVSDFTESTPMYWTRASILIAQYLCFFYLGVRNFDWPIFQGMIRQYDVLIITFCVLLIFSLDANQLKFLSLFWVIGCDCIRCKEKVFMLYILILAVADCTLELFEQLLHSEEEFTDFLFLAKGGRSLHIHSLLVSCIVVIIIRLFLPLYKLRPSHYSMSKQLLFVRKNRLRRDLLRYAVCVFAFHLFCPLRKCVCLMCQLIAPQIESKYDGDLARYRVPHTEL